MSAKQTIGWIGTGVMGFSMCKHILNSKKFDLVIYNRTKKEATEKLVEMGAVWADSIKECAMKSDIVVSIVGFPKDVEQVAKETLEGFKASPEKKDRIYIDMTTSKPELAKNIYSWAKAVKEVNVSALDAPVSGGDIGARNGLLMVMVGGDKDIYEKAVPLFQCFAQDHSKIFHVGNAGCGQHTKMSNQIFIASGMIGVVEGMLYAQKAGLDVEQVITACSKGAAQSFSLTSYGPRILKGDFNPGFYIEHFLKDMTICVEECEKMGITLPGLKLAKELYSKANPKQGTQGLWLVLKEMNEKQ